MIQFLRDFHLCLYLFTLFFRDLLNSLVTVFILFTLDHWYAVLQDIWKVPEASRIVSSIYIILWLLLGSIIFRNIIVAMMGKHRGGATWQEGWLGRNLSDSCNWWVVGREPRVAEGLGSGTDISLGFSLPKPSPQV
jgi:hypothetical protein